MRATIFIDASGDADVCAFAGFGFEAAGELDPAQTLTTTFRMANVNLERRRTIDTAELHRLMAEAGDRMAVSRRRLVASRGEIADGVEGVQRLLEQRRAQLDELTAGDTLLVKDGYSYGPQLDRLIAAHAPPPVKTSAETLQMLRMLVAGRAGWIIVTPEESQVLRVEAGPAGAGLRQVVFADISAGQTRHLYCNRSVPDAWLARIDQALAAQARTHAR